MFIFLLTISLVSSSSKVGAELLCASNANFTISGSSIKLRLPNGKHYRNNHLSCIDECENNQQNEVGVNYIVIRLKTPVSIKELEIDCRDFSDLKDFTFGGLQAGYVSGTDIVWETLIPKTPLTANSYNSIRCSKSTLRFYNLLRFVTDLSSGFINSLKLFGSYSKYGFNDR